jgi:serine-type D-Ala-D-Ala carboxypeptidase/endopeptidase (penicillin-binding protein 4)
VISGGRLRLALLPLVVLFGGCAGAVTPPPPPVPGVGGLSPDAPLSTRVEAITGASPLDRVHWGILVVDPRSGDTLYARNPAIPFVPASNMKVAVTHAALALLGPEYRWDTGFWTEPDAVTLAPDGTVAGGVIRGDLVLRGTGDPTLGAPFFDTAETALDALVATLTAAGVRRVEGRLVVDVSAWDSTTVPSSWMVGNLPTRSAAVGGAFSVGGGDLVFEVVGEGAPGAAASVLVSPQGSEAFVDNRIRVAGGAGTAGPSGAPAPASLTPPRGSYLPEQRLWVLEGQIAAGERTSLVQSQRDPVRLAAGALARAVERAGIEVAGGLSDPETPGVPTILWSRPSAGPSAGPGAAPDPANGGAAPIRIAGLESPTLLEVSRAILEPSQNWMTEQLVRTLGAEVGTRGSWNEGFRAMTALFTDSLGIDPVELHFRDGSGLSAYNLISPRALVRILEHGLSTPWGPAWQDAMAKPGEPGTLRTRLPELSGRVFAKTGSISHVNSLSGVVFRESGDPLLFAILTNAGNLPAADVRSAIDAVLLEIAR